MVFVEVTAVASKVQSIIIPRHLFFFPPSCFCLKVTLKLVTYLLLKANMRRSCSSKCSGKLTKWAEQQKKL